MAFPRRGSRLIIVDGIEYRWRVAPRPTRDQEDGWPGVGVAVSPVDCEEAALFVGYLKNHRLDGPCGDLGWPILPAEVALRIREAIAAGWQVDRPGKPFNLLVREADGPTRGRS